MDTPVPAPTHGAEGRSRSRAVAFAMPSGEFKGFLSVYFAMPHESEQWGKQDRIGANQNSGENKALLQDLLAAQKAPSGPHSGGLPGKVHRLEKCLSTPIFRLSPTESN